MSEPVEIEDIEMHSDDDFERTLELLDEEVMTVTKVSEEVMTVTKVNEKVMAGK